MARVKKGVNALKSRRNILKQAKGYRFSRSKKERAADEAIMHAGAYAFAHRRDNKNAKRMLWNAKINAFLRENGLTYSKFIGMLKKANVAVDRKILADMAANNPGSFKNLIKKVA